VGKGRGWGKKGEMTQTLYVHMNKRNNKIDEEMVLKRKVYVIISNLHLWYKCLQI
jgi:hypothetical protein